MELRFSPRTDRGTATAEESDRFVDRITDVLYSLEDADPAISDPDTGANLAERSMVMSMRIDASALRDAERVFLANIRYTLRVAADGTTTSGSFEPTKGPTVHEIGLASS
ncbi:hypothetical protein [Nocardiopsis gilva]